MIPEDRSKWSPELVALYDEGPELAGLYESLGEHCSSTLPGVYETRAVAAALADLGLRIVADAAAPAQRRRVHCWWCLAHDSLRVADEAVCDSFDEDTYSACSFAPLFYVALP